MTHGEDRKTVKQQNKAIDVEHLEVCKHQWSHYSRYFNKMTCEVCMSFSGLHQSRWSRSVVCLTSCVYIGKKELNVVGNQTKQTKADFCKPGLLISADNILFSSPPGHGGWVDGGVEAGFMLKKPS